MKNAPHPRSYPALRDTVHWLRAHILAIWLIAFPPLLLIVGMREKNEIVRVLDTLRGAESSWLLLGIGIEALIVLGPVLTYRIILSRLGHVLPFSSLVGMHMQRIVVGTLAPVSGPASAFAFVRALNHRAVATHDALTMLALRSVTTQTAFVLLMLGAIAARGPIYALSVGAVVVVLLIVMAPLLRRARIPAAVGPWSWRRRLPRSVSCKLIEFAARFRRHGIRPSDLSRPLLITIAIRIAGILLLIVSIEAMGADAAPKAVAMAVLAEMAAKVAMPVFHGIGVIEAATALALQQSGVPAEAAVGAALLWRGFEFWLPFGAALLSQSVLFASARMPMASANGRMAAWTVNVLNSIGLRRTVSGASEAS